MTHFWSPQWTSVELQPSQVAGRFPASFLFQPLWFAAKRLSLCPDYEKHFQEIGSIPHFVQQLFWDYFHLIWFKLSWMNEHTAFICVEIWADERTGDLQKMSTSNFYDLRKFSCLDLVSKNNSGFSVFSLLRAACFSSTQTAEVLTKAGCWLKVCFVPSAACSSRHLPLTDSLFCSKSFRSAVLEVSGFMPNYLEKCSQKMWASLNTAPEVSFLPGHQGADYLGLLYSRAWSWD